MTAPDHEQAERRKLDLAAGLGESLQEHWNEIAALFDERDALAAQLAEAQEGFKASEFANDALEDRCQRAEDAADKAVAQLAERERELEWAHSRIAELTAREAEEGGRKDG